LRLDSHALVEACGDMCAWPSSFLFLAGHHDRVSWLFAGRMKASRASVAARGVVQQHEQHEGSIHAYDNQADHKKWSAVERVQRVDEIVDRLSLGPWHGPWIKRSILLISSKVFRYLITSAIFVAALSVALQTYSIASHAILLFIISNYVSKPYPSRGVLCPPPS
jgi:hypothetical protein